MLAKLLHHHVKTLFIHNALARLVGSVWLKVCLVHDAALLGLFVSAMACEAACSAHRGETASRMAHGMARGLG